MILILSLLPYGVEVMDQNCFHSSPLFAMLSACLQFIFLYCRAFLISPFQLLLVLSLLIRNFDSCRSKFPIHFLHFISELHQLNITCKQEKIWDTIAINHLLKFLPASKLYNGTVDESMHTYGRTHTFLF